MAKLVLVALAISAILAFVEVSAYRTTITTTTIEDNGSCFGAFCFRRDGLENPRGCQIPIQKLNHCQMHLTQGTSFDYTLRMVVNPRQQEQQQHLNMCCSQLQEVERQCQCEAIKQVVEQAQKQLPKSQGEQGQMMEQMVKKALMLPNQCNLKCSI
uniref:Preproalbumin PawS1 n=1 Tax=Iostephane heterophylla TaxID=1048901 RepID=A0A023GYJ6_9ASTR|nr:preproalbumin PawS1 [Iostephane heterophylla]